MSNLNQKTVVTDDQSLMPEEHQADEEMLAWTAEQARLNKMTDPETWQEVPQGDEDQS